MSTRQSDTAAVPEAPVAADEILAVLDRAVADHLAYMRQWHRRLLFGNADEAGVTAAERNAEERRAAAVDRFGDWYRHHRDRGLVDQPAMGYLADLHAEILERAGRLGELAAAGRLDAGTYDALLDASATFVAQARRLERAFMQASSELDELTGLNNRIAMRRELERERARALRLGRPCSLAMADLDRFKAINDGYGHAAGDRVLSAAAACFLDNMRAYDIIYRYGGEEFLFCLPDTSPDVAAALVERVLEALRAQPVDIGDGRTLTVGCSCGISALDTAVDVEVSIARADAALYAAKAAGRGRVRLWSAEAAL